MTRLELGLWSSLIVFFVAGVISGNAAYAQPIPARPLLPMRTRLQLETTAQPLPFQNPAAEDRWLAVDKAKHAGGSFLVTLSSQYALTSKAGLSKTDALPLAVGISATMGLAKELYDWQLGSKRYFSSKDLVADALGIALAVGFIWL